VVAWAKAALVGNATAQAIVARTGQADKVLSPSIRLAVLIFSTASTVFNLIALMLPYRFNWINQGDRKMNWQENFNIQPLS
jgi:hypothetical protein